jgi:hypothetical protein
MKKIIGIAAITAMVASGAFAEITFGSWGRGLWYTAANAQNTTGDMENEVVTGVGQSWGGAGPRTALSIHGSTDNVGFNLDVFGNGDSIGMGDNANIWVKPIQQIQLKVGHMDDNVTRGDAVWGLWNWARFGVVGSMGEGFIFPDGDAQGAQILVTPVEGLKIIAALPLSLTDAGDTRISTELGRNASYFGMYTIKDIGTVKAGVQCQSKSDVKKAKDGTVLGYVNTDKNGKDVDFALIDAAFELTAVKNLSVSVGVSIPTATNAYSSVYYDKDNTDITSKIYSGDKAVTDIAKTGIAKAVPQINAYAAYTFDALTLHAALGTKINAVDNKEAMNDDYTVIKDVEKSGLGLAFGAGADYAFENNIGTFVDVRYANSLYENSIKSNYKNSMTFGAGVTKGFSNGSIGVAFEGSTNNSGFYSLKNDDDFAWAVPIKFEYSF